ncbi:MAG TPA: hypothetical protein VGY99_23950 [Candidatus Binataceae bacterium]|jgi:hypothetical protein|nr:hypothetical protein [Candidatus Binataceae bacterium]
MVEISVDGVTLVVEVLGWSKLWCLKSRLDIPLRCVRQVTANGALPKGFWLRWPGTYIPGVLKAGSYWNGSRWSFWDVRHGRDNVVVIELSGWKYDYLVVEVNNPTATIERVRSAISGGELTDEADENTRPLLSRCRGLLRV